MKRVLLEKTKILLKKIKESEDFFHVIVGPRQVGKTVASGQLAKNFKSPYIVSADGDILKTSQWPKIIWDEAINNKTDILIIDEIQKVENWAETIKELWDQKKSNFKLLLLGSSSLEIHKGLSDSLAGRFRIHNFYHWNFIESNQLKKMELDDYLLYGGYPGSYQLISDPIDWLDYIKRTIVDPVIGKDILSLARVKSPALFRQSFDIICSYAAQEISYTKLLGQLQDKGNTDLVKHYIQLFEAAFLVISLEKYSTKEVKKRSSSPKILPLCPALYSITKDAKYNEDEFGHAFEILIGAHLNSLPGRTYYWRHGKYEVDFIYEFRKSVYAIEVKYGKNRSTRGLEEFLRFYPHAKTLLIDKSNFQDLLKGHLIPQ